MNPSKMVVSEAQETRIEMPHANEEFESAKPKQKEEEVDEDDDEEDEDEKVKKPSLFEKYKWLRITRDVIQITLRVCLVFVFLYIFIVALDTMSSGFRICLGMQVGDLFQTESIVTNPVTGLIIGVLVTVIVQSSSASTSIVVSLVGAGILNLKVAIPIIMGANIGTSVTSTLVALTQTKYKGNFGRAFAGGTVHDAFNLLSVLVLLPLEMASGYLEWLSSAIVQNMGNSSNGFDSSSLDFMDAIKKPVTLKIIDIDSGLMQKYANPNYNRTGNETFLRQTCTKTYPNKTTYQEPCRYLFNSDLFDDWSETTIGIVVLVLSLAVVIGCLLMISKLLGALFQGATAKIVQKVLNANQEGIMGELIGYLSILVKA